MSQTGQRHDPLFSRDHREVKADREGIRRHVRAPAVRAIAAIREAHAPDCLSSLARWPRAWIAQGGPQWFPPRQPAFRSRHRSPRQGSSAEPGAASGGPAQAPGSAWRNRFGIRRAPAQRARRPKVVPGPIQSGSVRQRRTVRADLEVPSGVPRKAPGVARGVRCNVRALRPQSAERGNRHRWGARPAQTRRLSSPAPLRLSCEWKMAALRFAHRRG
jgi:hypothetical protein